MPGRPTTLAYGRAGAGRVGCFFIFFFISSILSSFPDASSVGRRLDILKYCGLGRYNTAVVVISFTTGGVLAKYCSLIQAVSQEEPSDRKPDPWPL